MAELSLGAANPHILKAKTSVEDADYAAAAVEFDKAIAICEQSLLGLYSAHASALSSAEQFDASLKAAEAAIRMFPNDATSWYWKGHALFKMEQRAKAKKSFEKAASLEGVLTTKMSYMDWTHRCDEEPKTEDDEEMEIVDATAQSDLVMPAHEISKATATPVSTEKNGSGASPQPPVDNTRMQWYQSGAHVMIDIYAKDVDREKSTVCFEPSRLKVSLNRANGNDYVLDKDLFDGIVVEESTWSASRFKAEIRMKKANEGSNWQALDKEAEVLSAALQAGAESRERSKAQEARQREWISLTEKELKDYKEDDGPMALFRTLYKDADEDMQRAMMKSYQESGGKVLSTNWEDVKKKKVVYEGDD